MGWQDGDPRDQEPDDGNPFWGMPLHKKKDIQLKRGLIEERKLQRIFGTQDIVIEVKSESYKWERTGNTAAEFESHGFASGIARPGNDWWVTNLMRWGKTLMYMMFPIENIRRIAREAYRAGRWRQGGDADQAKMVLISLRDTLQLRCCNRCKCYSHYENRMVPIRDQCPKFRQDTQW